MLTRTWVPRKVKAKDWRCQDQWQKLKLTMITELIRTVTTRQISTSQKVRSTFSHDVGGLSTSSNFFRVRNEAIIQSARKSVKLRDIFCLRIMNTAARDCLFRKPQLLRHNNHRVDLLWRCSVELSSGLQ